MSSNLRHLLQSPDTANLDTEEARSFVSILTVLSKEWDETDLARCEEV